MLGIDPWLIEPVLRHVRQDQLPGARKAKSACASNVDMVLNADPRKYEEYRHRPRAVRDRESRRRHLRHGHHDREERRRSARLQPQAAQQDGGGQGRPAGHPGHGAGRRVHVRDAWRTPSPSRWST